MNQDLTKLDQCFIRTRSVGQRAPWRLLDAEGGVQHKVIPSSRMNVIWHGGVAQETKDGFLNPWDLS